MTDHDIERLDKAIERLDRRLEQTVRMCEEQRGDIYRLQDKANRLEYEIGNLERQMRS